MATLGHLSLALISSTTGVQIPSALLRPHQSRGPGLHVRLYVRAALLGMPPNTHDTDLATFLPRRGRERNAECALLVWRSSSGSSPRSASNLGQPSWRRGASRSRQSARRRAADSVPSPAACGPLALPAGVQKEAAARDCTRQGQDLRSCATAHSGSFIRRAPREESCHQNPCELTKDKLFSRLLTHCSLVCLL